MYLVGNLSGVDPRLVAELRQDQEAMNSPVDGIVFNPLSAEPKKPQDGLTVMADGVNWDPLTLATGDTYKVCYYGGAWHQDT